ncbi:MAG: ATP synthase F1 subunit gamma [Bacilli bacterium]|nr:ATP synthase F1 subunit gamma [Bacilli bacterium]
MSLGLNKTKRRIASIRSTQKITKAMGMVAAVKLRRFRDLVDKGEEYAKGLYEVMGELLLHDNETHTHYSSENEGDLGALYIVVTSNLGLCAGYNNNIFKYLESFVDPSKDIICPLGEKGRAHYLHDDRYHNVDLDLPRVDKTLSPKQIDALCLNLKKAFNEKRVRKVVLVYTHYVNSISFVPEQETLLPLQIETTPREDESYCPPLFEPSARAQIHSLLPYYLGSRIYYRIAESQLCEQASRRNAMDNANDNADELLSKLTIEYNKARQTAITQEIVEVVSGSANATN